MGCPNLSPTVETICRWTALGLTCLSWIFVVASTATCSFVSGDDDTYQADLGLFCYDINGFSGRYGTGDLEGAHVAARMFATLACLTLSAALITILLVLLVLPEKSMHSKRAWWTTRILYCVALACILLTFTMHSESLCPWCTSGAGSILNSLNVFIVIALIVLSFMIDVPDKPVFPGIWPKANIAGQMSQVAEVPEHPHHDADDPDIEKPVVVSTQRIHSMSHNHRTEQDMTTTPPGQRVIREVYTHSDGRQEIIETVEEASLIMPSAAMPPSTRVGSSDSHNMIDQTLIVTQEMVMPTGTRTTVETKRHTDGRHEVIETVEEPSLIIAGPAVHYKDQMRDYPHDEELVFEVNRTRKEIPMPGGNVKVVEEVEYSNGTKEVVESMVEPSIIIGTTTNIKNKSSTSKRPSTKLDENQQQEESIAVSGAAVNQRETQRQQQQPQRGGASNRRLDPPEH